MSIMNQKILHFAQKGIVLSPDNKSLLMIKMVSKFMSEKIDGKWGLPGGKVEFGEEIDVACEREIFEETGVKVSPGLPIYTWAWTYMKGSENVEIVANARMCEYVSGDVLEIEKMENETKISKVSWVPMSELTSENCISDEWPAIEYFLENEDLVIQLLSRHQPKKVEMYRG